MRARLRGLSSAMAVSIAMAAGAGCASPIVERIDPMEIELDAFSGRPNPRWVVAPKRAALISQALSSLPSAPAGPEPEHLGYRGFIIRQGGLHARVYDGHVTVAVNGATRTFVDSAGLETQLIADARERGFGDIVQRAR